jgi:hypothetical protein
MMGSGQFIATAPVDCPRHTSAVGIVLALMTLTAIDTFGFLSRAHLQHQVATQ